jgi:bile acid:Na+ symporter, BASS family
MIETTFFSSYFLPATLALIILGMGMSLTAQDFRNIIQSPFSVIAGLVCQMVLLPATAFLVALAAGDLLSPEMKVGLILVAACPGGATAGLLSHLMKGHVALSVSITTVNSFLTIFSIPLIVNIALNMFMGTSKELVMPFWDTMVHIVIITVIPCIIGVYIRAQRPALAHRLEKPLKPIMTIALAFAIIAAMFLEKKEGVKIELGQFISIFPWALLLNVAGMATGWVFAGMLRLGASSQLTLGLEAGLHNTGLAIAVASSAFMLGNATLAIPAATYAMFSVFTAVGFGLLVNGKNVRLRDIFNS